MKRDGMDRIIIEKRKEQCLGIVPEALEKEFLPANERV